MKCVMYYYAIYFSFSLQDFGPAEREHLQRLAALHFLAAQLPLLQ
jgi:hypothetical protein